MRIYWDWHGALTGPTNGFMILAFLAALALPGAAHAQAPNQSGRTRIFWVLRVCSLALLCLTMFTPIGSGQGSRKDDIVLNRFGQPVAGATITICTSGATGTPCSPLASIYSDVALSHPLANPLTSDGQGNYHFYAAPARYMLQLSGAGITTTTIPDVLLPADPTSPSFQSLSVTQNISALNLNLSGNLAVSGGVSSPSTLSAPQQGSSAPVQIGPHWYAGTASGQCTAPGAPAVVVETISSGTGSIGTASYQYRVALYNRNGITNMGPATTYAAPSGSTNRILVQLGTSDYSYRSGCYGYRVYVSSDGGNTWWQQNAWTLPAASISSWSRNAAGLVTVITSANHGFIPGESITVSGAATGGSSTTINGTFTLVGQQASTPTTLFFFQSSSLGADSAGAGGTGTVVAGLGADPAGHFAPGDFILSTILTSGMQGPTTNTATIDPLQVALNATSNYAANSNTAGQLIVPQGTTTLTTPLIVSNQQSVTGVNSPLAGGKSEINCGWKDPNLACVMVMGIANGVRVEYLDIEATGQGHGLMSLGWGPGFASSHQFVRHNSIDTYDSTGQYAAIYIHGNTLYDVDYSGNFLSGGLAALMVDAVSGGDWLLGGGGSQVRWNAANLYAAGLATNAFLSTSSVSDPDRGATCSGGTCRSAFPNGASGVKIRNLETESATSAQFVCINIGCQIYNVLTADPNALASTPAIVLLGTDANAGSGNMTNGWIIEDSYFQPATFTAQTWIKILSNADPASLVLRNAISSQTNAIDLNNVAVGIISFDSYLYPYESATANKIINIPSGASVQVFGTPADGTTNTSYAGNWFKGGIRWGAQLGSTNGFYSTWPTNANMYWWTGDPASASNLWMIWSQSSGGRMTWYENDGATALADFRSSGGANQINLCNPGTPANNKISLGCPLVDSTGATVKGALTGTSGSLGGSALTAGTCSSATVTISGATTSMTAAASPATDPGSGFYWLAFVSASNTVTVRICAAASGTPTSTTYNVRVIQ